ncbi:MAG: alanine racemase [bacterium]|nr:alanine racemase [bacterium]
MKASDSLTWAEVNLSFLRHNFSQIKRLVEPARVMAVVKADAYGHGADTVSQALVSAGVDMLGVVSVSEGIQLRDKGIKIPILILGSFIEKEVKKFVAYQLTPTIFTKEHLSFFSSLNAEIGVHIKVDTGMGRLGVMVDEAEEFIFEVINAKNIRIEGIFSHFASANLKDKGYAKEQFLRFSSLCSSLKEKGIDLGLRHIANSSAILDLPETYLDMTRPGLLLYGLWPSDDVRRAIEIKPVLAFKTRIVAIKNLPLGWRISYGTTTTTKEMRVAILPVGYSHGYPRLLSNKGYVSIRGKKAPIIGVVCMDMLIVDLSSIPETSISDEVTLFGESISVNEIALLAETINYEIITRISPRIERIYIDN